MHLIVLGVQQDHPAVAAEKIGSFEQFVGQNDRLFPPSSVLRKVGMDI
jgi:hypothetical protein